MKRGYCGIGIWFPQKETNVGTLFRSALAFGADYIFTIGRKYRLQSSDTTKSVRHMPYFHYQTAEEFFGAWPSGARLVCVEIEPECYALENFCHPEQAIYLLGSEGGGLPRDVLAKSQVVKIDSSLCLNVAVAGSIVLYDRNAKRF